MAKNASLKALYSAPDSMRTEFYQSVTEVLENARRTAYRAINFAMVEAYWNIGRMIVEEEQRGTKRAGYGKLLIESLSTRLRKDYGKGFTAPYLWAFRQFYITFPILHTACVESGILRTVCEKLGKKQLSHGLRAELTWSHYRLLMRIDNAEARQWYLNEAADQGWSVRALERQIHSLYYERLRLSSDKTPVETEGLEKTASLTTKASDFIKDSYVLEFLGMPDAHQFRESELEDAIIGKLQNFILELGKGFAFVARQKRIRTETKDFFIDLVFYNYLLKCFILVDLKTGELTHQDIGQLDMYVRMYEETVKGPDDNPTVGLILCTEKDNTVVRYSVLNDSQQLFAAKYRLYLPSEQELIEEIEREKAQIIQEREANYAAKVKA